MNWKLLAVVCVAFLVVAPATPQTKSTKNKAAVSKLKGNLKNVQSKRSTVNAKLRQTKREVFYVKGNINTLDARLNSLENAIEKTRNELGKSLYEQRKVARELTEATKRMEGTKKQVRTRLKYMYIHKQSNVFTVLVDSKSIGDFASRAYLMKRVAQADRALFEKFYTEQKLVATKKKRADQLVVQIRALKKTQEAKQKDLYSARSEKKSLLSQLRDQQHDLERIIAQLDAEENSIQARIAAYQQAASSSGRALPAFNGRLGQPVRGRMTSGYGMRHHPILKRSRMHTGVDFGAPSGAPIYSAADGVVISASYSNGYGNCVIIDHGGGISTLYAHCSRMNVSAGQKVKKGQKIAAVGSTGLSTGPHLHFEVRKNGRPVNPRGSF